jgi:hypothetical protein
MTFDPKLPIAEYPGIDSATAHRLTGAGVQTLGDLQTLLQDSGRDPAEASRLLNVQATELPRVNTEVGLALGTLKTVSPSTAGLLSEFRAGLLSAGTNPNAQLEIHQQLLNKLGKTLASTQPTSEQRAAAEIKTLNAILAAATDRIAIIRQIPDITASLAICTHIASTSNLPPDVRDALAGSIQQAAADVDQVQNCIQNSLVSSIDLAVGSLSTHIDAVQTAITRAQPTMSAAPMVAAMLTVVKGVLVALAGALALFISLLAKLKTIASAATRELLKKLALLIEFAEWMYKYEGAVVYCYTFCIQLNAQGNLWVYNYANFWDCVKDCLDKKGATPGAAIWDVLKQFGPEVVLALYDP